MPPLNSGVDSVGGTSVGRGAEEGGVATGPQATTAISVNNEQVNNMRNINAAPIDEAGFT
jgi:hypothetical protein